MYSPFQSWQEAAALGSNQVMKGFIVMEKYNLHFGTLLSLPQGTM